MPSGLVTAEEDGPVAVLRLNRPEVYNALNIQLLLELERGFVALASSGKARCVILTGAGDRAFSVGTDLHELAGLDARTAGRFLATGQRVFRLIEESEKPVIAAVGGLALGGGFELALVCTFPVLATDAVLGLPESGLGLIPGYGGSQRLTRLVGKATAQHLMLTSTRMTAERAYQIGLTPVEPVERHTLLDVARDLGREMARKGPEAIAAILTTTRLGADAPLGTALALEATMAGIAIGSTEGTEGIDSFRTKRTPLFEAPRARRDP